MKFKRMFLALFAATCLLLPACGDDGAGGTEEGVTPPDPVPVNPYATAVNLEEDGLYYLLDAESYWQCAIVQIQPGMKTEMCSDKEFVKHGENSLKVSIKNGSTGWAAPRGNAYIGISCSSSYFQKTNFSDCDYFSVEIYNAQDFPVTFWTNPVPLWACGFGWTIQPGWNTVVLDAWKCNYKFNANATPETIDSTQSYLSEINSFQFAFPSYEQSGEQVYYIDSFVAHKKAE